MESILVLNVVVLFKSYVQMIAHQTEHPLSLDTTTIVSSLQPKVLEDLVSKANNTKKQN